MLQQTTVAHATPYFEAFTTRWPDVAALAAAPDTDVMSAWAGLGYYARARNLLACARVVAARGGFPQTEFELRTLPGIGPYTAGAIAALAFDQPAAAIDGNVERVFARVLAFEGEWKAAKIEIARTVRSLVPASRPGAFAEALMDLGATVCTPRAPNCAVCPIQKFCAGFASGSPTRFPIKPPKAARPQRFGTAYVLLDRGDVWLMRRPAEGLLGGMLALPSSAWLEVARVEPPPINADWQRVSEVRHVFTHFDLKLEVQSAQLDGPRPKGEWTRAKDAKGLPSVFAKALRAALN